ncbi:MAG TPA: 2-amino-4-hydroxy-6-hydroxymethyldihydropteridine diphosphokinase [Chloroflexi bacterium]|nr:2-amino-4-hydroxy-6-hydroxymethyldihydropteridine diphosphokinase [Chloroflexota bacterium]
MKENQSERIFLSLGTNLGNREMNLEAAKQELPPQVKILECSSIYQTEPWGYLDQPDFLNQVLAVETSLSPHELLTYVKDIEQKIGRKPSVRFGPRIVDIDILFYGDRIIQEEDLVVPHSRLKDRAFVLIPLAEIDPDLIYPGTDLSISDLLLNLELTGVDLYQE